MVDEKIENEIRQFCDAWQRLNMIYEDYARSQNIPYTNLYILSQLARMENCTQKMICERTLIPKQTVNTIITYFYKSQMVELREVPEDRRSKSIHLTQKGREYAEKVIPHIHQAEVMAMEKLSNKQREALLEAMKIYCAAFGEAMLEGK